MTKILRNYVVALGSNQPGDAGSSLLTLQDALNQFVDYGLVILKKSSWFSTPALPIGSGPDFINAAALCESSKDAGIVLQKLHTIESALGRVRGRRWASRVCDLDLIAAGDAILPDRETQRHWMELPVDAQDQVAPEQLILPHPRLQDRAFVLLPLAEIVPEWVHPVTGLTPGQMLARLPAWQTGGITRLDL